MALVYFLLPQLSKPRASWSVWTDLEGYFVARRVVLIASSHPRRLDAWQAAVRQAGYLPLAAADAARAFYLLNKIRPSLVLLDAEPDDMRVAEVLHDIRAIPSLEVTPVLIVGALPAEQQAQVARDAHAVTRPAGSDGESIVAALHDALGGPRPTRRR